MALILDFVLLLQQSQWLTLIIVALLGLCVGSFLNVVIYRTPLMMEQQWKNECQLLLHPETIVDHHESITLSRPASRCPHCGHSIRWFENMPVISWLLL